MMTREMVIEMLEGLGEDMEYFEGRDGVIHADVQDFEGFNDEWEEVFREYDHEAVGAVYDALTEGCNTKDGDFYEAFEFDGFTVVWGYDSMNI